MVRTCMFCGAEKLGEDLTYHSFPLMAAEWLYNMGLGSNFVPPKNAMLCSNHFEKKCFQEGTGKGCLLPGSIPTIFGQYKSGCVFCHARKGQDKNRSFRKFPLNNAELLQKWIAAMAIKDFVPNKRSVLCSEHFEKDCFRKTGRNACTLTLKNNAVPTIFKLPLIDKTRAGEHNINSQLPASHMETNLSLSPEISTVYEGREKRCLSLDLPPPKMSKTDTKYSMVNPKKHNVDDLVELLKWLEKKDGQLALKKNHLYYAQVQISMAILNLPSTDLIIYSSFDKRIKIIPINFNLKYTTHLLFSLKSLYFNKMLHNICEREKVK